MILLINACARPQSRTLPLAHTAAQKFGQTYEILNLFEEDIKPLNYGDISARDTYISKSDFSDPMFRFAKQFRSADKIVIAAPYWDLSFPSVLKCYIEAICVNGLTFFYNEKGIPQSLCRASQLVYVTTSGGFIPENNYGYNYIRQLCTAFWGIHDTICFKAEGLDIVGADIDNILETTKAEIAANLH